MFNQNLYSPDQKKVWKAFLLILIAIITVFLLSYFDPLGKHSSARKGESYLEKVSENENNMDCNRHEKRSYNVLLNGLKKEECLVYTQEEENINNITERFDESARTRPSIPYTTE